MPGGTGTESIAAGRAAERAAAGRAVTPPALLWAAGLLLTGIGLFFGYLAQARTMAVNSDGASIALQAWEMLHGNLLLHGWMLADVSFYTTELPEYLLVEAIRGLSPDVVHVAAALTYTLLVLLAALVGRGRARGREGVARALVAGGIMAAPAVVLGTRTLLSGPDHIGTGVPLLLLLLLLDRARPRWYVPAAVLVMLTWVEVADRAAIFAMALPLALVCLVRALAGSGRHDTPPASRLHELWIAAAAVASVPLAREALAAVRDAGGFTQQPLARRLVAPVSQWPSQARLTAQSVQILFGAENFGQHTLLATLLAVLHAAGLALAAWGLLSGIVGFFRRPDRVSQVLVAGTLAMLAAGTLGTYLHSLADAHEIAIVLPFGAALAGRMFPRRPVPGLEPVLAAVLACYLAALGYAATWGPAGPEGQGLASWLAAHDLTHGLAAYWQANSVALDSGLRVDLSPAATAEGGHIGAYWWESSVSWYDPRGRYANFAVIPPDSPRPVYLTVSGARRAFGPPARVYHVGAYTIMVWDNENLLARLGAPVS